MIRLTALAERTRNVPAPSLGPRTLRSQNLTGTGKGPTSDAIIGPTTAATPSFAPVLSSSSAGASRRA